MLWFGRFLWPFLRITGLFLTAPLYGSSLVPNMVKAMLAAALALCLAMWLPNLPPYPADPFTAIFTGFVQIAYGGLLGMAMQIVVAAFSSAGEVMGQAMGLSFAELQFRGSLGSSAVLSDLMLWAGLLGYMAAGGPVWLFAALARSFAHGAGVAPIASWAALAGLGGTLFTAAIGLALPVMAATLCVNLTVGLTTVFAPSMNLLSIGFPLLILAGLWVLVATIPGFGIAAQHLTGQCMETLSTMLPHG
ncbi:MAG: flagellar biosynthetic protein FliR [Rhodospirillales bacterium]|nr:flagellar biosynthetic protein FliR [Rhodospirillales bacterium]MDE1883140.1 flagellar biosynthetic protein FliR [Rhodospirillales bacterium]MDE2390106.1 flagellar biosynthetic protein FliR [Rhodospirillales bacterium]MDE2459265.1 flagellar biosynthetic protein FliR [Rhodospirillales bacterium]